MLVIVCALKQNKEKLKKKCGSNGFPSVVNGRFGFSVFFQYKLGLLLVTSGRSHNSCLVSSMDAAINCINCFGWKSAILVAQFLVTIQ